MTMIRRDRPSSCQTITQSTRRFIEYSLYIHNDFAWDIKLSKTVDILKARQYERTLSPPEF